MKKIFLCLAAAYVLLTSGYAVSGFLQNIDQRVRPMDAMYYYIYLRSAFMDGDLDFTNEITRLWGAEHVHQLSTPSGRPGNQFSVGPAICWFPFFLLAHLATLVANYFGAHLGVDGYSSLYQSFVYIGNSFYVMAGLFFLAKTLRLYFKDRDVLITCLSVLFATQLTYYIWSFSTYAHNAGFFAVSIFLYFACTRGIAIPTAICAGLVFLTRWQNALFFSFLGVLAAHELYVHRKEKTYLFQCVKKSLLFVVVFLVTITPQLIVWNNLYGSYIAVPPGVQSFSFFRFHLLKTLFGTEDGIFLWHPLLLVGLSGLFFLRKKLPVIAVGCFLALAVQIYFVSTLKGQGYSFGNRYLIGTIPFFSFGVAAFLQRLGNKRTLYAASIMLVGLFILYNLLFVFQYQNYLIPHGGALSFRHILLDKLQIAKVYKAEKYYFDARDQLMRNNVAGFYQYASKAYALNPHDEKKALALGLASVFTNDSHTALVAFETLHRMNPGNALYLEGLAGLYAAVNAPGKLDVLLQEESEAQRAAIRQRIAKEKTVFTDDFVTECFKRLTRLGEL